MTELISFQNDSNTPLRNGWKIFMIGLFLVNYGGVTGFQLGITNRLAKFMLVWKLLKMPKIGNKIRMSLIHGSLVRFGHSRRWRSEEHTSELQSRFDLVCSLLREKAHTI